MDTRGKISVAIDAEALLDVITWDGPSGTLRLIFTDGHEAFCTVPGRGKREYTVQHGGTVKDVYFAYDDDDPEYWYSIG